MATMNGKPALVGYNNFVRHNPMSDRFVVHKFDHVEVWCADATNTSKRQVKGRGAAYCGCCGYLAKTVVQTR